MSGISFLEKLLDGVEVEWKTLGEIAKNISSGGTPQTGVKEYWEGGTIPWMSSGEVNLETIYETENFITEAGLKNSSAKFVPKNSLVIALAGQGKTRGKVARTRIDLTTNQSLASIAVDEGIVNPDYLYHFLKTQYENLRQISSGNGTRGGLNLQMISGYKFPLPCPDNPKKSLEIQAEIVRILDAFTELTTELTAELTARKKQYNHYRDQLLSFEEGVVEWKTLGAICEIGDGNHSSKYPRSDEMVDQGVPFIRGTNMVSGTISGQDMKFITPEKHQELRKGHLKAYDVLIANRGEVGKIAQIPKDYAGSNLNSQLAWLRADPVVVLPRYLFYVLNATHIQSGISGEGGALQQLTIKNIKLIRIPVPALENQARIVGILDKFDALTHSLSEGLPREIELRQKQYAYYRDLLLSFPKDECHA